MTYQQTLDYLYAQLPMFHRIGPAAYKANLDNTLALARHLGNPEKGFRSVHVAGTNGKGSVSHMLASVLQEAGYKTGLCTSPHLKDFRERFRINGQMIAEEYITSFVEKNMDFFHTIKPSFFEMTIAMAFAWFAEEKVDIAIIETGLGGRLDSTNIISPELAVITNVGLDHVSLLGNTIEAIAHEKAGIIKPGIPVVVGKSRREAMRVFEETALLQNAPLTSAAEEYRVVAPQYFVEQNERLMVATLVGKVRDLSFQCPLSGTYQLDNICTMAAALDTLRSGKQFLIDDIHLVKGLRNVIQNTSLLGRWQILAHNPLTICDTGHNADGINSIMENIRLTPHKHLHFVLGMMNDKDLNGIFKLLPVENTTYYFCKPQVPRGLDADHLAKEATLAGLKGNSFGSVVDAVKHARGLAGDEDLIFIGGSTFVVAEVL